LNDPVLAYRGLTLTGLAGGTSSSGNLRAKLGGEIGRECGFFSSTGQGETTHFSHLHLQHAVCLREEAQNNNRQKARVSRKSLISEMCVTYHENKGSSFGLQKEGKRPAFALRRISQRSKYTSNILCLNFLAV